MRFIVDHEHDAFMALFKDGDSIVEVVQMVAAFFGGRVDVGEIDRVVSVLTQGVPSPCAILIRRNSDGTLQMKIDTEYLEGS